jgi:molybdenum cofactor cytidylyltransferase
MATIGVVPAAGKGSRFAAEAPGGPHKLLALVDGEPMVRRTVASLLAGGADRCVVVVSADGEVAVRAALAGLPISVVVNPDPSRGMFSSIQSGIAETAEGDVCVLLPGDMPYVQPATVAAVIAAAGRTSLAACAGFNGRRGHPIVCSAALRARILLASVESTLSAERSRDEFLSIDVPDPGVHRDVDRPGDMRKDL